MSRILFISQMGLVGKVPGDYDNMRVPESIVWALDAHHIPFQNINVTQPGYDHIIVEIAKTPQLREGLYQIADFIPQIRKLGKKVWFMQEGPVWIYQDMPLHQQIWHYNVLAEVDGILAQNDADHPYFEGLVPGKEVRTIPSVMPDHQFEGIEIVEKEEKVIIGGNMVHWYGGFDSYMIALEFGLPIVVPSMGRKKEGEEWMENLTHLPYMKWQQWIWELAKYKVGIHLMPTFAAGTFAMNCGFLGIPCIGYENVDTQRKIHPHLSVELEDLKHARKLAKDLKTDKDFFKHCANEAKENFEKEYSVKAFKEKAGRIFV